VPALMMIALRSRHLFLAVEIWIGDGWRQLRNELIARIGFLPRNDRTYLSPGFHQSARARRHIVFYQGMQLFQVVAGYSGVHVMLGVIIHAPIEKAEQ